MTSVYYLTSIWSIISVYFHPTMSIKHAASTGPHIPPEDSIDITTDTSISVTFRKTSEDIISSSVGDDHPIQFPMPI